MRYYSSNVNGYKIMIVKEASLFVEATSLTKAFGESFGNALTYLGIQYLEVKPFKGGLATCYCADFVQNLVKVYLSLSNNSVDARRFLSDLETIRNM